MIAGRDPFDVWLEFLEPHEGGESNDPADRGRRTVFGISSRAHPDVDLATLTRERARDIARSDYWVPCGCEALASFAPRLAVAVADYGFNSGPVPAVCDLQACVGAVPDGRVGPRTLEAVRAVNRDLALALALNMRRRARLRRIAERPSQARFLRGWLRRVDDLDALLGCVRSSGAGEG